MGERNTEWQEEVSRPTIIDWHNFIREVCEEWLLANTQEIGGLSEDLEAIDVEIDESKYFHRKYHQATWRKVGLQRNGKGEWEVALFLLRTGNPLIFSPSFRNGLIRVPGSSGLPIAILQTVVPVFIHRVNYIYNFVSPLDREVHNNHVDNMWMRA